MSQSEESVISIKEKGNDALKQGKYEEAVLHYTHAIKLDAKNYSIYSNRSYAFLKMQQYYYALDDAKETIKLNPQWPKGYFRRAEVEFATFHFSDALVSYQQALILKPDDCDIANAISRANKEWKKDLKADDQIPWLGAGIGIVLGVIIVIADFICTNKPTLTHPLLMASLTIAIAMMGYGAARAFRYYVKCQRNGLLEVPVFLDEKPEQEAADNETTEEASKPTERTTRYTKTQARYRYKKGKM
ncbi:Stress induced phosphoprotein 1 [Carabus blaptoides fortunei]